MTGDGPPNSLSQGVAGLVHRWGGVSSVVTGFVHRCGGVSSVVAEFGVMTQLGCVCGVHVCSDIYTLHSRET